MVMDCFIFDLQPDRVGCLRRCASTGSIWHYSFDLDARSRRFGTDCGCGSFDCGGCSTPPKEVQASGRNLVAATGSETINACRCIVTFRSPYSLIRVINVLRRYADVNVEYAADLRTHRVSTKARHCHRTCPIPNHAWP